MKKIAVLAAVLSVAGLVFAGGAKEASADKPLELIVAHNQTSLENPYAFAILKFKEVAEAESGGKIKVVCHHGTMGENENELVEQLDMGVLLLLDLWLQSAFLKLIFLHFHICLTVLTTGKNVLTDSLVQL